MAKQKTNKERLICIEGLLDRVLEWQSNHMDHHKKLYDRLFRIFLVGLGIGLTAIVSIATALVIKSS